MFLGQVERVGMFNEYCRMCGAQRVEIASQRFAPAGAKDMQIIFPAAWAPENTMAGSC